jgi:8-oxo-dGTP pyrophosphatase MutT (NUDIX family)
VAHRRSASTSPDTVVRETREEAGVDVEVEEIVGLYTNPNHVVEFGDREVR